MTRSQEMTPADRPDNRHWLRKSLVYHPDFFALHCGHCRKPAPHTQDDPDNAPSCERCGTEWKQLVYENDGLPAAEDNSTTPHYNLPIIRYAELDRVPPSTLPRATVLAETVQLSPAAQQLL